MRTTIIEVIELLNRSPHTIPELCEELGHEWNTVRKTMTTLQKAGWVSPCGFKRRFKGGVSAILWQSLIKRIA